MLKVGLDLRGGVHSIHPPILGLFRVMSLESNEVHIISDMDEHTFSELPLDLNYTHYHPLPECHGFLVDINILKYKFEKGLAVVIDGRSNQEVLDKLVPRPTSNGKLSDPFDVVFGHPVSPFLKGKVMLEAKTLLEELRVRFLDVVLIEAPEQRHHGHMIRVATNSNPQWYRKLYENLDVKRDRIISSLIRVSTGKPSKKSSYDKMFINEARDRLVNGYTCDESGNYVKPNDDVLYELYGDTFSYDE